MGGGGGYAAVVVEGRVDQVTLLHDALVQDLVGVEVCECQHCTSQNECELAEPQREGPEGWVLS